jgi:hypothetical protein
MLLMKSLFKINFQDCSLTKPMIFFELGYANILDPIEFFSLYPFMRTMAYWFLCF